MTAQANIQTVTEENFMEVVINQSQQQAVLIDFWADWCEPCKSLMPVLEGLAAEFAGKLVLAKVNADEQPNVTAQFGVQSLPTVALIKNGQVVDHFMGAKPAGEVREWLKPHLQSPIDLLLEQVEQLWANEEWDSALEQLQAAWQQLPDNSDIAAALLQTLLKAGRLEDAGQVVASINEGLKESESVQAAIKNLEIQQQAESLGDGGQLQQVYENDPTAQNAYDYGMWLAAQGNYEVAMQLLLDIFRKDRNWQDGKARETLMQWFVAVEDKKLVATYQRKLMTLMF